MGFHGYGGCELDHSDCIVSPCSACRSRLEQQQQPSFRSGNAYSNPTSNPNGSWSRAGVFGHENNDSNEVNRATVGDSVADNTGDLSGDFRHLSLSEEDCTMRDEMHQPGFGIPSNSEDPALHHPVGSQHHSEDPGFQYQNQYQPNVGRVRLSDEDRALRDEMRRPGFRIPSVSDDPALSHPDGSQNRSRFVDFQAQGQYQAYKNDGITSSGGPSSGFSTSNNQDANPCPGCQPNSRVRCSHTTYTGAVGDDMDDINDVAPWALEHPTNQETLNRALHNKALANARSQASAGNSQPSTQPGASSQGGTGHFGVPTNRPTRQNGTGMHHDGTDDWESASGRRAPAGSKGWAEGQNKRWG